MCSLQHEFQFVIQDAYLAVGIRFSSTRTLAEKMIMEEEPNLQEQFVQWQQYYLCKDKAYISLPVIRQDIEQTQRGRLGLSEAVGGVTHSITVECWSVVAAHIFSIHPLSLQFRQ